MPFPANATPEDRIRAIQERLAQAYHGDKTKISAVRQPFYLNKGKVPDGFNHATEISFNRDMQDFSPFLELVNLIPRTQEKGGSLMVGSQGRVTRTNDTYNGTARRVGNAKNSKKNLYEMVKAHSDFRLHDDDISAMSEFPDWEDIYRQAFMEAMANDRIIIGWHGEEHAATSNMTEKPLLQDVNIGWNTLLEQRAPSQVMVEDEIKIGKGAGNDFVSVDHLVSELLQGIPLHRRKPGMTAMLSESLMGFAETTYYREQADKPTEKAGIQTKTIIGTYGGLDSIPAPYMRQTGIFITPLARNGNQFSNLSIYWKKDSWQRYLEYEPKMEASTDWNARREAYHIEDLDAAVALKANKIIFTDLGKDDEDNWIGEIDMIPENNWADQ